MGKPSVAVRRESRALTIEPEGEPCTLADCRMGLFLWQPRDKPESELCMKVMPHFSETFEVYCATGSQFWAGTHTDEEYETLIVQPARIVTSDKRPPTVLSEVEGSEI